MVAEAEGELQRASFCEAPVDDHGIGQEGCQCVQGWQIALLCEVRVDVQGRALATQADCRKRKKIDPIYEMFCLSA